MPRTFNPQTKEWVNNYKGSASKNDTRNPCALCGWGPHMAIHCVPSGTKPTGTLGLHSWVPIPRPTHLAEGA